MNRSVGLASILAVGMMAGTLVGCGSPSNGAQNTQATTCGGAAASTFAGSCTHTFSGLTTCAEDYYSHALAGSELDVYKSACSGTGFTFSATDVCPTANVACKCVDTSGSYKRIKYGYGTYADACGTCTGDCYSKQ